MYTNTYVCMVRLVILLSSIVFLFLVFSLKCRLDFYFFLSSWAFCFDVHFWLCSAYMRVCLRLLAASHSCCLAFSLCLFAIESHTLIHFLLTFSDHCGVLHCVCVWCCRWSTQEKNGKKSTEIEKRQKNTQNEMKRIDTPNKPNENI